MWLLGHCYEKTVVGIALQSGKIEPLRTGNETERHGKRERTGLLAGNIIMKKKVFKNVWEVVIEGRGTEITSAGKVRHLQLTGIVATALHCIGLLATSVSADTMSLKEDAEEAL